MTFSLPINFITPPIFEDVATGLSIQENEIFKLESLPETTTIENLD